MRRTTGDGSAVHLISRRRAEQEFADEVGPFIAVLYAVVGIFLGSIFMYSAALSFKENISLSILLGFLALAMLSFYGGLAYLCWFRRYDLVKLD